MVYRLEAAYVLALVFPVFTVGLPWLHQADENGLLYVKILEEIYEPGPSNTRHVGDRVKRSADVMPSSLHFQIRYGSREQNIRMRRNAFGQNKEEKSDVPDFPVFIIENGRIKRKELQHDKGIALYSNETTGSSFLVRKRSNRADFVLNGVFYDGLDQLYLTRDADGGLHQIHKQNGVVDFRNDYISSVRGQGPMCCCKKPGVRSKRQLMQAGENEVQLFMIADNKDYRTWLKYYRHNATLTQIEMNLYYAFIANSMNVRYSSIKNVDSSFSLKILISGLLIVNSQKISTWTEDSFDPVTHCVDASRALESFRLWVKSSRYDLPPSDHWMLFTGFDISTDGNRNVADICPQGDDPTAPCALDDCPYYTNRTKLVYCCHTCRQMPTWQEDRSLVVQVVRQVTYCSATKPTSPSDVLYDIVSESVISNVTLPNLLSVLISNRNDTWQFGNVERLFGQEIIGMSSSRQSHISLSETVLSSVSSFKSRNHSLDDRRQRSKERGKKTVVYDGSVINNFKYNFVFISDHKDTTEKISEIITRIEATNRTKTFDQSMHRNITYHHYDNPLLTSDEETASVNVSASPATQSLNTSTSYTSLQNDSLITSVISLLSSIGSVQSFQNHNLAHEDNQKQPWNDLHMKTNKIEKNTHLPSVEGQSLVSSVEGQSLVSSVEGQS
ncbi:unnamed protein product, partial [Candidula unifasciata]